MQDADAEVDEQRMIERRKSARVEEMKKCVFG
jgi:hypothetical protein